MLVDMLNSEEREVIEVRVGRERRRSAFGVGGSSAGRSSWRVTDER